MENVMYLVTANGQNTLFKYVDGKLQFCSWYNDWIEMPLIEAYIELFKEQTPLLGA